MKNYWQILIMIYNHQEIILRINQPKKIQAKNYHLNLLLKALWQVLIAALLPIKLLKKQKILNSIFKFILEM